MILCGETAIHLWKDLRSLPWGEALDLQRILLESIIILKKYLLFLIILLQKPWMESRLFPTDQEGIFFFNI